MRLNLGSRSTKVVAAVVVGAAVAVFAGVMVAFATLASPAPLIATNTTFGNQVSLSWTAVPLASNYVVQYKLSAAGDSAYTTADVTANTTDTITSSTGLLNGSTYVFRVMAQSLTDTSPWAVSGVVTPSDQQAPTGLGLQTVPSGPSPQGWFSVTPTYTILASDPSGVATYYAGLDSSSSPTAIPNGGPAQTLLTAGPHTLWFQAIDSVGNASAWATRTINIDTSVPTASIGFNVGATGSNGWYKNGATPTITLSPFNLGGQSGIRSVQWNFSGGATNTVVTTLPVVLHGQTAPINIPDGANVLYVTATNDAGTTSTVTTAAVNVDRSAPSVPGTPTLTLLPAGNIQVTWPASTDATPGSGVATYSVSYDTTATFSSPPTTVTVSAPTSTVTLTGLTEGLTYYVRVNAADAAGNVSANSVASFAVPDSSVPSVAFQGNTATGMWSSAASLPGTVTASDPTTDLVSLKYRVYPASGTPTGTFTSVYFGTPVFSVGGTFTVGLGKYEVQAVATDGGGNVTTSTAEYWTDNLAPVSTITPTTSSVLGLNGWYTSFGATVTASDIPTAAPSGIATMVVDGVTTTFSVPPSSATTTVALLDGTTTMTAFAIDAAANQGATATLVVKLDTTKPTAAVAIPVAYTAGTATQTSIPATITAADASPGSGVNRIEYAFLTVGSSPGTATTWTQLATSTAVVSAPEGNNTLWARSFDNAGNQSATQTVNIWVDTTNPVTSFTTVPAVADGGNGTWKTAPTVNFSVSDVATGLVAYSRWDTTGTLAQSGNTTTCPSTIGTHTLEYRAIDTAGNVEATKTATFVVNTGQPITSGAFSGGTMGLNGWYTSSPTFTITRTWASTGTIQYAYDSIPATSGGWTTYASPFVVSLEGSHTIYHRAIDGSGTVGGNYSNQYNLDTVMPTIGTVSPLVTTSMNPTLTVQLTDASSGIDTSSANTYMFTPPDPSGSGSGSSTNGSGVLTYKPTFPYVLGQNIVSVIVHDKAGNLKSQFQIVTVVPATYTLTYTPGANGTITGTSPQTVNYQANGSAVTAVPNTGYHFVNWSDGSMANPRTDTTVTANVSVTANFAINTYTLSYAASAGGSLTGFTFQTVNYLGSGTAVTAVANSGYHFVNWSDASVANPRTDTSVTGNISVTANFAANAPVTYTLTYTAGANGTITGTSPQTVNSGANGSAVTAVPNTGYHFVNWSDGSVSNPRTDSNVTGNISVTANFAINTYTLSYAASAGGSLTGFTFQTVNYLGSGTLVTAVADTGYHFVSWSDGVLTAARTDTVVTANKSVTANFAANPPVTYTLTYTAGANGTITGTSPQTVNSGANGSAVTAVPNAGYHFVNWSDASTANPRTDTNVTANVSVTANFAANTIPTTLTIASTAASVVRGHQFILSGLMTPTPGTVGFNVIVWVKKPGKTYYSYSSNRTVYAGVGGAASWQYKYNSLTSQAKGTYVFYAQFIGNGSYLPCQSVTKSVVFK